MTGPLVKVWVRETPEMTEEVWNKLEVSYQKLSLEKLALAALGAAEAMALWKGTPRAFFAEQVALCAKYALLNKIKQLNS